MRRIAISSDQRDLPFAWSRVPRAVCGRRVDEHVLDHRGGSEQIEPRHQQLGIGGQPLQDHVCETLTHVAVFLSQRRFVAFEQRHEIANEQRNVHGVGVAGHGEHFGIVERTARLGCAITLLRAQMPAGEHRARLVRFEPIPGVERLGDACGDSEVRREVPGQRPLCGLDQPARIANERGSVRAGVQSIEQALYLVQTAIGLLHARVPDAQAEMLEKTDHEGPVDDVGKCNAPVPSWPSRGVPMVVGAHHEIHGIEPVRVSVPGDRLEAVFHVGGGERCVMNGSGGEARPLRRWT